MEPVICSHPTAKSRLSCPMMLVLLDTKGGRDELFPLGHVDMANYGYLLSHTFFIRTDDVG
jgi:hypothetical protein